MSGGRQVRYRGATRSIWPAVITVVVVIVILVALYLLFIAPH
jgi:hypothetical protein